MRTKYPTSRFLAFFMEVFGGKHGKLAVKTELDSKYPVVTSYATNWLCPKSRKAGWLMSQPIKTREAFGSNEGLDSASTQRDNAPENSCPYGRDLFEFVGDSLAILWKDWPRDMKLNILDENAYRYSLSGTCPHCQLPSVFVRVTDPYRKDIGYEQVLLTAAMECQGCQRCILSTIGIDHGKWEYLIHYPLDTPDDSVDENVPEPIAEDFSESMRCLSVKSHKAAVAMCRRSVEAACKDLGAKGKDLYQLIENLAEKDAITDPMRRMAHQVRLTANRKLHDKAKDKPKENDSEEEADDLGSMREKDARAMITFTKEFFHHVYAIRALLEEYENPQGGAAAPVEPES